MKWEQPATTADALLGRVEVVRASCREYRRERGEAVWEPPDRFDDGSLRGWRTWAVSEELTPLRSFNGAPENAWQRGVLEARCLRDCRELLSPSCTCGVYAFTSPAAPELAAVLGPGANEQAVLGQVSGWGRVSIHEDGWRAEFAMIRRLWTRGFDPATTAELASYYDASVHDLDPFLCQTGEAK